MWSRFLQRPAFAIWVLAMVTTQAGVFAWLIQSGFLERFLVETRSSDRDKPLLHDRAKTRIGMHYVVIPTYQERDNIVPTTEAILALPIPIRILIVDDQSTDGTAERLCQLTQRFPDRVEVIYRAPPRSFAGSYIEGFERVLDRIDCESVIECDADGSHPFSRIPDLVHALERAEVAIGSRYVPGGNIDGFSKDRLLLSAFANRYLRLVTGLHIADITAGFIAYRAEFLRTLPFRGIHSNGYAFQIEMKWLAERAGGHFVELPITFIDRSKGQSKMSFRTMVEAFHIGLRYGRQRTWT